MRTIVWVLVCLNVFFLAVGIGYRYFFDVGETVAPLKTMAPTPQISITSNYVGVPSPQVPAVDNGPAETQEQPIQNLEHTAIATPERVEQSEKEMNATVVSSAGAVEPKVTTDTLKSTKVKRLNCVEIGHFLEDDVTHVKKLLGKLPPDVRIQQKRSTATVNAFRVYLNIPDESGTQERLMNSLKEKRIDFFVTTIEAIQRKGISLGVFKSAALAKDFQQQMITQGFNAQLDQQQRRETVVRLLNAPDTMTARYAAIRAHYPKTVIRMRCM